MREIDWGKASREDRQILYSYLKAEMDRRNMTLHQLLEEALGSINVGQGYDANMRSGRFSRKYAHQFHDWLERHNPARAANVTKEILATREWEIAGAWHQLVGGLTSSIAIIDHPERQTLVKFADDNAAIRITLGKPFFFRIDCPAEGFAIGFQQMNTLWYPLPLGREAGWVPTHNGRNDLPCRPDGTVDPLVEETQTGPAWFVIVFALQMIELEEAASPAKPISRQRLDAFAEALDPNPRPIVFSTRVIIT